MRLKQTAAVSLSAVVLTIGGAGTTHANEAPKFQNDTQILSCLNLRVGAITLLGADNDNIDCSRNHEKKTKVESVEHRKNDASEKDHDFDED
ncbi:MULTISPECIES: hypothetical protein [Streptomyces]|uniref:Secreted protein n=1 Tax=Streptomyces desertarenae TaxID=2666184 RepID=A0ABW4PEC6_9ACTN